VAALLMLLIQFIVTAPELGRLRPKEIPADEVF
jgi:hypothetical protein